jgi:hypothetical protein
MGGPSPRSGHSAVALFENPEEGKDGPTEIVVFGGWNGTDWFDDAHLFNSGESCKEAGCRMATLALSRQRLAFCRIHKDPGL